MSSQPLFSILHTSVRPYQWRNVYEAWINKAHDPACFEYVLVVDHDWGFERLPIMKSDLARGGDKAVWQRDKHNYVHGVNLAAANSKGRILIVNADDQFPCQDWDLRLMEQIPDADADFIVLPSTGTPSEHEREIAVMPIMSRARYSRLGYVLFPAYESMYADNDFLAHARQDGVVIEAKHLMFPHLHPIGGKAEWDDAYKAQNRREAFEIGSKVFEARRQMKFGDGSSNPHAPHPATRRPTMAMCLPGERFSSEWVVQLIEIIGQLSPFFEMAPMASYSSNVYVTRGCLADAARQSNAEYVLWIDDDNLVPPAHIMKLFQDMQANPNIDVICGWCWLQTEGRYGVSDAVSLGTFGEPKDKMWKHADLMEGPDDVKEIGWTGFPVVLMKRSVLERLGSGAFNPILSDRYAWGISGEDIAFSKRCEQSGIKIYVDRTVKVQHLKWIPAEPHSTVGLTIDMQHEPPAHSRNTN